MRILGIDPGSRKAGYGIVEKKGRKFEYIASGLLRYDSSLPLVERLPAIYESCHNLVTEFQPDVIAVEALIHVKNVSSLAKLSQARGAMIAAVAKSCKVYEYSPTMVKSSVAGHGLSDKIGVQKMVSLMLGNIDFKSDDESDALAIALCHGLNNDIARMEA